MQIDTSSPGYLALLDSVTTIRNQLNNNYMPVLMRMTKAQLKALYQRDPLFKECVLLAKDLNEIANSKDIEL